MRKKILIVDDEALNRELLRQIFQDQFEILMAGEGKEAIQLITQNQEDLAAVLLDLMMPQVNGYQVLQVLNYTSVIKKIPVILITSNTDTKIALSCYSLGVADVISKPFVAQIVRRRVMNIIEMYRDKETLEGMLEQSNQKLTEQQNQLHAFYDNLVDAISNLVEFRDVQSGMHVKRVKGMTEILAKVYRQMYPEQGLTDEKLQMIVRASALHDIGKLAIPDTILLKPGVLTESEREVMKSHTTKGCEILTMLENVQDMEEYKMAYDIVRYHHERIDGKGYPDGLKGDEIPLSAQLVSVVDVYDALVSERIYKKPYSKERAYKMIVEGECGAFSDQMMKCLKQARKVLELFSDTHR